MPSFGLWLAQQGHAWEIANGRTNVLIRPRTPSRYRSFSLPLLGQSDQASEGSGA